jgi:HAD superfamily hydrolase (TIGR01458 family)
VSRPRGIVLDMEGVLHIDWTPIPGSARAVEELRAGGVELAVLTNTTGRSRAAISDRLGAMGMPFAPARIVTAASATGDWLRQERPRAAVHALVEDRALEELAGVRLVERAGDADVVVLGGPGNGWTYARIDDVFRAVKGGAELVAMQRNRWWPTAAGPRADAGLYVAGLEYAAAVRATVLGKPSPAIYRAACAAAAVEPSEAMMVGDDPESDLAPARAAGMRTCLVRTGKGVEAGPAPAADLDVADLAGLPRALADAG